MGLELNALGADGEVGEPLFAPEAGEREGWCGTPPYSVSLVAAALAGCEEDEALELPAAVRARFGAILTREVWG